MKREDEDSAPQPKIWITMVTLQDETTAIFPDAIAVDALQTGELVLQRVGGYKKVYARDTWLCFETLPHKEAKELFPSVFPEDGDGAR